jgi:hypothetical protein
MTSNQVPVKEEFQPIAVMSPANHPCLFKLRCLVDLQLDTIVKNLRPALVHVTGSLHGVPGYKGQLVIRALTWVILMSLEWTLPAQILFITMGN